jgi:hypothetical protein
MELSTRSGLPPFFARAHASETIGISYGDTFYPAKLRKNKAPRIQLQTIGTKYWNLFIQHDELWPALHFTQMQNARRNS